MAGSRWLARQAKDVFVRERNRRSLRSRSAIKLEQIGKLPTVYHHQHIPMSYSGLRQTINTAYFAREEGAFPSKQLSYANKYHALVCWTWELLPEDGAKLQWSAHRAGKVVMNDLLPVAPLRGAEFVQGDFEEEGVQAEILRLIGGRVDVVLSDMAPNASGLREVDHLRQVDLARAAFAFSVDVLKWSQGNDSCFVCKVYHGSTEAALSKEMGQRFETLKKVKPSASRKGSREIFYVCKGLKG